MKITFKSFASMVVGIALLAFSAVSMTSAIAADKAKAPPRVEIKTSEGSIVLELYPDKAPLSVDNFLQYTRDGFYNNTIFHRVIDGFMIQGGGFDGDMTQKSTRAPIKNEAKNGLSNKAGTIAMARTSNPHSATGQFFINLVDNTNLDYPSFDGWGYAVFGKVITGFDVVQKIGKTPTGFQDVPRTPITILSVSVLPETK
jgi:peptidyl-prolyl cis-trans isomerase A (cyclophilin A)